MELGLPQTLSCFLLKIAQLSQRKGDSKMAKSYLHKLNEQKEHGKLIQVELSETIGDLMLHEGHLDKASESFVCASKVLTKLMEPSYILSLVNIFSSVRVELTPGETKVVSRIRNPPAKKKAQIISKDVETEECISLQRSKARIQFKQGQVARERGCLDDSLSILVEALSKLDELESSSRGSIHNIDRIAILYHLGRLSVTKSLSLSPNVIDSIWNNPSSLLESLEEAAAIIRKEEKIGKRSKRGPYDAFYYIEKARLHFSRALECCLESSTPNMLRDVCQELAVVTGNLDATKTAAYLNLALGNTALQDCLTNIRQKLRILEKKAMKKGSTPGDMASLTESLQKMTIGSCSSESQEAEDEPSSSDDIQELTKRYQTLSRLRLQLFADIDDFGAHVSDLPPEWTVCTLSITTARDVLLITRVQSNRPSVTVRIPLVLATKSRKVNPPKNRYDSLSASLQRTIQSNKDLLKQSRQREKVDKNSWWDKRHSLNSDMEQVISTLEEDILGGWKSALVGSFSSPTMNTLLEKHFKKLVSQLEGLTTTLFNATTTELLRLCFYSFGHLERGHVRSCLKDILGWNDPSKEQVKILVRCLEAFTTTFEILSKEYEKVLRKSS